MPETAHVVGLGQAELAHAGVVGHELSVYSAIASDGPSASMYMDYDAAAGALLVAQALGAEGQCQVSLPALPNAAADHPGTFSVALAWRSCRTGSFGPASFSTVPLFASGASEGAPPEAAAAAASFFQACAAPGRCWMPTPAQDDMPLYWRMSVVPLWNGRGLAPAACTVVAPFGAAQPGEGVSSAGAALSELAAPAGGTAWQHTFQSCMPCSAAALTLAVGQFHRCKPHHVQMSTGLASVALHVLGHHTAQHLLRASAGSDAAPALRSTLLAGFHVAPRAVVWAPDSAKPTPILPPLHSLQGTTTNVSIEFKGMFLFLERWLGMPFISAPQWASVLMPSACALAPAALPGLLPAGEAGIVDAMLGGAGGALGSHECAPAAQHVEAALDARRAMAAAVCAAWFGPGGMLNPASASECWITDGLCAWLSLLYVRAIAGPNEYMLRIARLNAAVAAIEQSGLHVTPLTGVLDANGQASAWGGLQVDVGSAAVHRAAKGALVWHMLSVRYSTAMVQATVRSLLLRALAARGRLGAASHELAVKAGSPGFHALPAHPTLPTHVPDPSAVARAASAGQLPGRAPHASLAGTGTTYDVLQRALRKLQANPEASITATEAAALLKGAPAAVHHMMYQVSSVGLLAELAAHCDTDRESLLPFFAVWVYGRGVPTLVAAHAFVRKTNVVDLTVAQEPSALSPFIPGEVTLYTNESKWIKTEVPLSKDAPVATMTVQCGRKVRRMPERTKTNTTPKTVGYRPKMSRDWDVANDTAVVWARIDPEYAWIRRGRYTLTPLMLRDMMLRDDDPCAQMEALAGLANCTSKTFPRPPRRIDITRAGKEFADDLRLITGSFFRRRGLSHTMQPEILRCLIKVARNSAGRHHWVVAAAAADIVAIWQTRRAPPLSLPCKPESLPAGLRETWDGRTQLLFSLQAVGYDASQGRMLPVGLWPHGPLTLQAAVDSRLIHDKDYKSLYYTMPMEDPDPARALGGRWVEEEEKAERFPMPPMEPEERFRAEHLLDLAEQIEQLNEALKEGVDDKHPLTPALHPAILRSRALRALPACLTLLAQRKGAPSILGPRVRARPGAAESGAPLQEAVYGVPDEHVLPEDAAGLEQLEDAAQAIVWLAIGRVPGHARAEYEARKSMMRAIGAVRTAEGVTPPSCLRVLCHCLEDFRPEHWAGPMAEHVRAADLPEPVRTLLGRQTQLTDHHCSDPEHVAAKLFAAVYTHAMELCELDSKACAKHPTSVSPVPTLVALIAAAASAAADSPEVRAPAQAQQAYTLDGASLRNANERDCPDIRAETGQTTPLDKSCLPPMKLAVGESTLPARIARVTWALAYLLAAPLLKPVSDPSYAVLRVTSVVDPTQHGDALCAALDALGVMAGAGLCGAPVRLCMQLLDAEASRMVPLRVRVTAWLMLWRVLVVARTPALDLLPALLRDASSPVLQAACRSEWRSLPELEAVLAKVPGASLPGLRESARAWLAQQHVARWAGATRALLSRALLAADEHFTSHVLRSVWVAQSTSRLPALLQHVLRPLRGEPETSVLQAQAAQGARLEDNLAQVRCTGLNHGDKSQSQPAAEGLVVLDSTAAPSDATRLFATRCAPQPQTVRLTSAAGAQWAGISDAVCTGQPSELLGAGLGSTPSGAGSLAVLAHAGVSVAALLAGEAGPALAALRSVPATLWFLVSGGTAQRHAGTARHLGLALWHAVWGSGVPPCMWGLAAPAPSEAALCRLLHSEQRLACAVVSEPWQRAVVAMLRANAVAAEQVRAVVTHVPDRVPERDGSDDEWGVTELHLLKADEALDLNRQRSGTKMQRQRPSKPRRRAHSYSSDDSADADDQYEGESDDSDQGVDAEYEAVRSAGTKRQRARAGWSDDD